MPREQVRCRNDSCGTSSAGAGINIVSADNQDFGNLADLELVFVERHRQRCVSIDFVHKLATGHVLKDDAAGVLAQSEGQEGALQDLLSIGLDAHPVPINAKGLGEQSASWHHAGVNPILLGLFVFCPAGSPSLAVDRPSQSKLKCLLIQNAIDSMSF